MKSWLSRKLAYLSKSCYRKVVRFMKIWYHSHKLCGIMLTNNSKELNHTCAYFVNHLPNFNHWSSANRARNSGNYWTRKQSMQSYFWRFGKFLKTSRFNSLKFIRFGNYWGTTDFAAEEFSNFKTGNSANASREVNADTTNPATHYTATSFSYQGKGAKISNNTQS